MSEPIHQATVQELLNKYLSQSKEHAIFCMDAQGVVIAWMGAAEKIFGYTAAEAVGKPGAFIFTPQDREKGFDQYELDLAAQHSRADDDRWHLRKDGTRIWVTGSMSAIKSDAGELLGYVKVVRDKTDLRIRLDALENQVTALGQAREKTHLFLSTLGHELRNPLAPIQTAASIIQKLSADTRTDKAVQVIVNQVAVLARLTEDLMDLSRSGAGKIKLELRTIDLRTVLNEAVFSLRRTAADKGVALDCLMPDTPLDVPLDHERFQRVVLNLLSNSIKYTNAGGKVWVKATQDGEEILFSVEDNGIGIAPDVLPRIFDLFTQEHQAADLVPGGLGIGLAIVKELVELHGGSVQARSAGPGKGAEFTVRLPAAAPTPDRP
jgi:PAS domain S-box-containing protein